MNFTHLLENYDDLIGRMRAEGYAESYIGQVATEVRWLERNGGSVGSYEEACAARASRTESPEMRRRYRLMYGILMRFDLHGIYPDRRSTMPLFRYGAYESLEPAFKRVIDSFRSDALSRGLNGRTVKGYASSASRFLLAMQTRGLRTLDAIAEEDAMAFFTGDDGGPALCSSYAQGVAAVLGSDLGEDSEPARRVLAFIPRIRPGRKNVQYLKPGEVDEIRAALGRDNSALTSRDRAIGALLLFTGLRAGDIAGLTLGDISWEKDEIRVTQAKTGVPLVLPLTAPVGNAILGYLEAGRPESESDRLFLGLSRPHDPLTPCAIWHCANRLYRAAGVRGPGERRGTHLFRYNLATAMVGAGVPRPVVSASLGHEDPASLDCYLSADLAHLRECALDVGRFPVREGVFAL